MSDQTLQDPAPRRGADTAPILEVNDLVVEYNSFGRKPVRAVDQVSFALRKGETLGLVGESGCGKSSTGKSLVQLPPPTAGEVLLNGRDVTKFSHRELKDSRREMQLIFQDPISSLNPRRTAQQIVAEPLRLMKDPHPMDSALRALEEVGVDEAMAKRRPHQLSGGQCQRISIARAIVQRPEVLICDEPVSALDVSVQAQVLNLLEKMKAEYDLSMVFISHDLAVVNNVSDRVAVMYLGRICELATSTALYAKPKHHYTNLLLSSVPQPGVEREPQRVASEISAKASAGLGCPFAPRCPAATEVCLSDRPELIEVEPDHLVACHHPL